MPNYPKTDPGTLGYPNIPTHRSILSVFLYNFCIASAFFRSEIN
jgi:hypothetical protein